MQNAIDIHSRVKTAPATPYTITALIAPQFVTTTGQDRAGILFRESGTSKMSSIGFRADNGQLEVLNWTNNTTLASFPVQDVGATGNRGLIWLRLIDTGVNLTYHISMNGQNFTQVYTQARGVPFTVAPDQYGFWCTSNSAVATGIAAPTVTVYSMN